MIIRQHPASSDAHGEVTVDDVALAAELAGTDTRATRAEVADYALRLGDDALILAQQLSGWIARAPEIEEDMALGNIALDLLGHARALLRYAGSYDGRSEDDLAYFRDADAFRCAWLFCQPNGDFAQTIARQLVASTFQYELYGALQNSTDPALSAIAAKAVKEVEYHRDHAVQWTLRLAGGTDLSRRRMIRALGDIWPYVDELFRDEPLTRPTDGTADAVEVDLTDLDGVVVRPSTLRAPCLEVLAAVCAEAELELPDVPGAAAGGRQGRPFPALAFVLAEMQVLARAHPGATW